MQAMPFPNILAFVEGNMERMFINNNFHYVELITVMNGDSWSEEAMSEQILTKFITKDANPDLIWIWLDREDQNRCVKTLKGLICKKLASLGVTKDKIKFLIPDKMTENLILADEEAMKEAFENEEYRYEMEGENGKSILKQLHKRNGVNYKETFHGLQLLKKIRIANCAKTSPSAKGFFDETDLPCWWLENQI